MTFWARVVWAWRHWRHRRTREQSGVGARGVVRDAADPRDLPYRIVAGVAPAALPPVVDLRARQSPVRDQGAWESCVAHALTSAMEYLRAHDLLGPALSPPPAVVAAEPLSPMFVWYEGRAVEGTVGQNVGMGIRDAVQTLVGDGVSVESLWPYDAAHLDRAPTPDSVQDAAQRKVQMYLRVNGLEELKQSLADGYPVVVTFLVYPASVVGETGVIVAPVGAALGWHAVLAVGYDDIAGRVAFKNSWGTAWGLSGYGSLPYSYFADPNLTGDMWSIRTEAVPDRDALVAKWVAEELGRANAELQASLEQTARGQEALARAKQLLAASGTQA